MRRIKATLLLVQFACYVQSAPIEVLNLATEVKARAVTMPRGTALLMKYYTPWCGHCRSLGPGFELAKSAVELWDSQDAWPTEFGELDCEAHPAACKKLGVVAFPSLKFYNNDGNAYMEYPRLPRTPEALTAYLARYRRVLRPYPLVLRDMYTERNCAHSLKFKDSICRAFRIENYLVGGSEAFLAFNKGFKNAPSAFIEFIDDSAPKTRICIVDRFTRKNRYCIEELDLDNEKTLEEFKKALLLHRHPYVIEDATWYDFFQLRLDTTGKRVVVVSSDVVKKTGNLVEVAKNNLANFLFITTDHETKNIFTQAGVHNGFIVFESAPYDRGFYHLSGESTHDLADWLHDISEKKIRKQFPPGSKSASQEIIDAVLTLPGVVINGIRRLSLRRKAQLLLTAVGVVLGWIYLVMGDDIKTTRERSRVADVRGSSGISCAAADAKGGVCLINGEITSPGATSAENGPDQNE